MAKRTPIRKDRIEAAQAAAQNMTEAEVAQVLQNMVKMGWLVETSPGVFDFTEYGKQASAEFAHDYLHGTLPGIDIVVPSSETEQ